MRKKTGLKIIASMCLMALVIPLFSAITPTAVLAAEKNAPFPYAMEAYGQEHSGIYAATAPTMDGTKDAGYTEIATFGSTYSAVFASSDEIGSSIAELNSEYLPKGMEIFASYDEDYLYFYITAETRENENGYALSVDLSSDFGAAQPALGESYSFEIENGVDSKIDPSGSYFIKGASSGSATDSTGTYGLYTTSYELKLERPEGDYDRLYFSFALKFLGNQSEAWWIWGVHKSTNLPIGMTVGTAFEKDQLAYGNFVPGVLELLGTKAEGAAPSVDAFERKDQNTTEDRSFTVLLSVAEKSADVAELGVLKMATAQIGSKNITEATAGVEKIVATKNGTDTTNGSASVSIPASEYDDFFSLRPYVKLANGNVIYGDYYTASSRYYDDGKLDYENGVKNILMIGCSFSTNYINELIEIGKEHGYFFNVVNTYFSGTPAQNNWLWLANDYRYQKTPGTSTDGDIQQYIVRNPESGNLGTDSPAKTTANLPEVVTLFNWDIISVQDHYGSWKTPFNAAYKSTMPYLPNIFRYLEVNFPNAKLYLHQTWAFQVGYRWKKPVVLDSEGNVDQSQSTPNSTQLIERVDTVERQTNDWATIKSVTEYFSETREIDMIPSGTAWQNARWNEYTVLGQKVKVGDILCNKGENTVVGDGDFYHDGTTGGGQYLNALVWFETITGESCIGSEWRPTTYTIPEQNVLALQMAAHDAVASYYGENFAN